MILFVDCEEIQNVIDVVERMYFGGDEPITLNRLTVMGAAAKLINQAIKHKLDYEELSATDEEAEALINVLGDLFGVFEKLKTMPDPTKAFAFIDESGNFVINLEKESDVVTDSGE